LTVAQLPTGANDDIVTFAIGTAGLWCDRGQLAVFFHRISGRGSRGYGHGDHEAKHRSNP
jgi:hypothetical protein